MARGTRLRLARDFALPVEAATVTFAILGKRGRGKTHTATVLAEGLIEIGCPVSIVDTTGVWFGLRSSPDGREPALPVLPVLVLGGEHGDLDLPDDGGRLADVLVAERIPVVLDVSGLRKRDRQVLVADFLEQLYLRNREAMHVILDEADEAAPQRSTAHSERLLGATEDVVRRGRARGLGVTLVSQRPAALHKTVLSQVDTLITLGMTAPQDVRAIDAWVSQHADEHQARVVKKSLPALPVGHAWVWSPEWLGVLRRIRVRPRHTFDSSSTPLVGGPKMIPRRWARVDLAALAARLGAVQPDTSDQEPVPVQSPRTRQRPVRAARRRDSGTGHRRPRVAGTTAHTRSAALPTVPLPRTAPPPSVAHRAVPRSAAPAHPAPVSTASIPGHTPSAAPVRKGRGDNPPGMRRISLYVTADAAEALQRAAEHIQAALGEDTPRHVALSALLRTGADQAADVARRLRRERAATLADRLHALDDTS